MTVLTQLPSLKPVRPVSTALEDQQVLPVLQHAALDTIVLLGLQPWSLVIQEAFAEEQDFQQHPDSAQLATIATKGQAYQILLMEQEEICVPMEATAPQDQRAQSPANQDFT